MTKAHQKAFNKAFLDAVKNNDAKKLIYNKKTQMHDVMVPVATVISSFRPFIDLVEKDLKLGKHKPNKQAKAKKTGRQNVSKNR